MSRPATTSSHKCDASQTSALTGLMICVNGQHRGACVDFRDDWKGDPLALVMRERRYDFGSLQQSTPRIGACWD